MAIKKEDLTALVKSAAEEVLSSSDAWEDFLSAYAHTYKYSCLNGLAIYAQRPDAKRCAPYFFWTRYGYEVKRGTKGIRVIERDTQIDGFAYLYEATDTVKGKNVSADLTPWSLSPENYTDAAELLCERLTDQQYDKNWNLRQVTQLAVFSELLRNFTGKTEIKAIMQDYVKDNSEKFEADTNVASAAVMDFLTASTQYIVLTRLGLDTNDIKVRVPSEVIGDNHLSFIAHFGSILHKVSYTVLTVVERELKEYIKNKERNRENGDEEILHLGDRREVRDVQEDGNRGVWPDEGKIPDGELPPGLQQAGPVGGYDPVGISVAGAPGRDGIYQEQDARAEDRVFRDGSAEITGSAFVDTEDEPDTSYRARGGDSADSGSAADVEDEQIQFALPQKSDVSSAPVVSVSFSEHPLLKGGEQMSFALFNRLMYALDEEQIAARNVSDEPLGYYKTGFSIDAIVNGERFTYNGRYDIGSEHTDVVGHIRDFYNSYLSPSYPGQPRKLDIDEMESCKRGRDYFLPFLETHESLSSEDQKRFGEMLSSSAAEYVNAEHTETHIFIDPHAEKVYWIYLNMDADAGAQYVECEVAFNDFLDVAEDYDVANRPESAEEFANYIEEMSRQTLSDIGTPFFLEAKNEYEQNEAEYIEFTPENILSIRDEIVSLEVDRKSARVIDILEALADPIGAPEEKAMLQAELTALEAEVASLAEVTSLKEKHKEFSANEFEKLLPTGMRYKQVGPAEGKDIYWVTQGIFTEDDLHTLQQALKSYNADVERIHITARDLSPSYNFEDDRASNVLAVVTRDTIFADDYLARLAEAFPQLFENDKSVYDIGMGRLGNGVTVYNRAVEVDNDYQHIAHISTTGEIKYYVDDLPEDVIERIESAARQEKQSSESLAHFSSAYGRHAHLLDEYPPAVDIWQFANASFAAYGDDARIVSEVTGINLSYFNINSNETMPTVIISEDDLENCLEAVRAAGEDVLVLKAEDPEVTEYAPLFLPKTAEPEPPQEQETALPAPKPNGLRRRRPPREGSSSQEFDYMLLSRLQADCEYFLGAGNRSEKHLWAGSVEAQISEMRELYNGLKEKPEWLTLSDIDEYERKMSSPVAQDREAPAFTEEETHAHAPEERHDYHITDNTLGVGSAKEKFWRNIRAIATLKTIETSLRTQATPAEQQLLSRYVGWGGLADAFDASKSDWAEEYAALKEGLTEREYADARDSVTSSFYTSPEIISAMYNALAKAGFSGGRILEPSCGVGNFIGCMPQEMYAASKVTGIEIDNISARIAKLLYPSSDIRNCGFEDVKDGKGTYDLVVGNVPFGDYKVYDEEYNKHNFLIHDYFLAKAIDMLRPGGVLALITSSGTLDKKDAYLRNYLAERGDFCGAVRLPDNAFKANAGTEATTDILFITKRAERRDFGPENIPIWTRTTTNENGIPYNLYFKAMPFHMVGLLEEVSGPFGNRLRCKLPDDWEFAESLKASMNDLNVKYLPRSAGEALSTPEEVNAPVALEGEETPAYSFGFAGDTLVFNGSEGLEVITTNDTAKKRITGMIGIREAARELIKAQVENRSDEEIEALQATLNRVYDDFSSKYGHICDRVNGGLFQRDSGYPLLSSLEKIDEDGNFVGKEAIFTRRTVRPKEVITSVDNAIDALAVSLNDKGYVDIPYMAALSSMPKEKIIEDLTGRIYELPGSPGNYVTADEFLSGNVREKLAAAKYYGASAASIAALERALPEDLGAEDIDVRLGSTWVPTQYYKEFMDELLNAPSYRSSYTEISYSEALGRYQVSGKGSRWFYDVAVTSTYGTERANAYRLIEDALNLRSPQVTDEETDPDGKTHRVVNAKETAIACQKQEIIKNAFREWVWQSPRRREALCRIYNERFNSFVPRHYDGSHLTFDGMNAEVALLSHQKDAIARQIYGGNTLLYQAVGAGKTFEMVAAIMEKKRLGLCHKAMIAVPNHLVGQWAQEFMYLYPNAKILAVTEKDFTAANRKKFCTRIATSDVDAVIIAHSQFEMIPVEKEREVAFIREQINDIERELESIRSRDVYGYGNTGYSVKKLVSMEKKLKQKLEASLKASPKDDAIKFEELGVDFLCVDEAHAYKNLAFQTKMRNVAGLSVTGSNRAFDMFLKCRYLDEVTNGKGITFATGTAISNSVAEMYTVQKYLQYNTLKNLGMLTFDSWASNFGATVTTYEIAPEGNTYRQKTRFAKYFNMPELMNIFTQVADIKTHEQLPLKVPEAVRTDVVLKPSPLQKAFIKELGDRADAIRLGNVDPRVDNMLKVTTDGRKVAVDERLADLFADEAEPTKRKVDAVVENCMKHYREDGKELTQLIFCDLGTPKGEDQFSVYQDLKNKLMANGVPAKEIAFAHDAKTTPQKNILQAKVRAGKVRFLIGSTEKMGAGMNVQDKLIALHHIDVPWRPSDIEQREGRILRQGNNNDKVHIYRYITENTFDAYSWQLIENKQKFISSILSGKSISRSCDEIDELVLSAAQAKACAAADPLIKEKIELDTEVNKLTLLRTAHMQERFRLEDRLYKILPVEMLDTATKISHFEADIAYLKENPLPTGEKFSMKVGEKIFDNRTDAGEALIAAMGTFKNHTEQMKIGEYNGFDIYLKPNFLTQVYSLRIKREASFGFDVEAPLSAVGIVTRIGNAISQMPERLSKLQEKADNIGREMDAAKEEIKAPFKFEKELREKEKRLEELNAIFEEKPDDGLARGEENENDMSRENRCECAL